MWRNWQTRGTQNPVDRKARVGSIPSTGTTFPMIFPKVASQGDLAIALDPFDLPPKPLLI